MNPIVVSVQVDRPREEVFAFLDVLSNHEPFTDHMLVDWSYEGPAAGVGARARLRANLPGPKDWVDMEVVSAKAPEMIVEESVGAKGRRRTRGTYTLRSLPGGGTDVQFELRYLEGPLVERIVQPFLRVWLKRVNARAMTRLGETLAGDTPFPGATPTGRPS